MTQHWAEQVGQAVDELTNKCFEEDVVTIVIQSCFTDGGKHVFDASIVKGVVFVNNDTIADYIGAESLSELLQKLNEALK